MLASLGANSVPVLPYMVLACDARFLVYTAIASACQFLVVFLDCQHIFIHGYCLRLLLQYTVFRFRALCA